jgi:methylenetetrahydrofolate dehydrogenase (NADP+)/methenyltetrahydrofolate cyclohydrolase
MGKIIDGKVHAQKLKNGLKEWIANHNKNVTLVIFQAGDNPASNVYVRNKQKACEEVGIESKVMKVDTPAELRYHIAFQSSFCDAMMVQLPLFYKNRY